MFFSSEMLSKRGPLAKVWLAAHVERKVSKAQTLQTSIPSTVTVILEPASTMVSAPPLALRLSGQLLLGIARIYSKQAKYLLEDCSEASDKIRSAFRSETIQSMIDEPAGEDHLILPAQPNVTGRDAINLRSAANRDLFDFELEFGEGFGYGFGDGWEDVNQANGTNDIVPIVSTSRSRIDGNLADITLTEHQSFMLGGDQSEERLDDLRSDDMNLMADADPLDLGLVSATEGLDSEARAHRRNRQTRNGSTIEEEGQLADETMEMEVGRDAPGTADRRSARDSLLPEQLGDLSVDKSYDVPSGMGDTSFDLGGPAPDFEPTGLDVEPGVDLNQDTGIQDITMADGQQDLGAGDGQMTPRATTPVPNPMLDQLDVTPRTSHHLAPHLTSPAVGAEGDDQQPPKKKKKHQLVDRVTELAAADHLPSSLNTGNDHQSTLDPPRFLPKDRYQLQHHRIMLDPSCHEFLPQLLDVDGERWLMAAPAGLCKELQELFKFPAKASAVSVRERGMKRLRDDEQEREELESEHGRRAPSAGIGEGDFSRIDTMGDETFDLMGHREDDQGAPFGADDGFQFELADKSHAEQESSAPNDLIQPNEEPRFDADLEQPLPPLPAEPEVRRQRAEGEVSKLDVFDDSGDTQSQSQAVESIELTGTANRTKWSKNTVKALTVLKTELADGPDVLKFKEVSDKASRRAGAAFFFELLVLGTRDCLKLSQSEPFGEIEVESQDRLWEVLEEQAI
ncbi:uncharacterized protein PGTG_07068 [Puccinia graminis f. sp. tritici CRL 75-36-700-3]|uniref:Sister chromatid cohesion protein 1 n=1 Tax=Puccinia graminis f. sp. tritici (strain CRL 75-36-700-3 / race SCCL) TaxID=418459 RepID=E3KAP0_PUCGT|nr:uncharacterized protein PGTG_07068 [Puccinia graminis f. sp. tritici CRL 75-36-700-3]EFP81447.2 hypothetical protein PGTG_07068 [Puccinia graminis f. sp. tritici CRL 75-36-700-3]